jgi:apolipoprotein B
VGVEGKGFEPTLDALFGERGFFPEAASNSMYNSGAYKVPKVLQRIFDRLAPDGNRMKRQVTWYQGPIITSLCRNIRYTLNSG